MSVTDGGKTTSESRVQFINASHPIVRMPFANVTDSMPEHQRKAPSPISSIELGKDNDEIPEQPENAHLPTRCNPAGRTKANVDLLFMNARSAIRSVPGGMATGVMPFGHATSVVRSLL